MAVIEGNTGSVRLSPHAIKMLKPVNFMLPKQNTTEKSKASEKDELENVGYLCFRGAAGLQKLALTAVHVRGRHFSLFQRLLWR